ncbi:MAG: SDR family NAD(P)-dependent oxidoreductase, partial [Acidimicrobiaceae bacterium]|nr:SDR family NAD(P)-dependent oxidoreductase [Acidimicrobiaceae bacterium]
MQRRRSRLAGQRIAVTGASSGIGRAVVMKLTDLDASVVACARNEAQLAALAGTSERISPVAADLTTEAGRRAL